MSHVAKWSALLISVTVFLAALAIILARAGGYFIVYDEQSGSMRPVIPVGAAVVMSTETAAQLRTGQIVATIPPKPFPQEDVIHEVAKIHEIDGHKVITTRGVANKVDDPWRISMSKKIWREVMIVPYAGGLAAGVLSAPIALLGSVAAIIVAAGIFYIWREMSYVEKEELENYVPKRERVEHVSVPA